MNTKVKCRECGEMILREEAIEYGNEHLCQKCFDDEYVRCYDCNKIIHVCDVVTVNRNMTNERFVCDSCASDYSYCDACGEYFTSSEIWARDNYRSICNNCSSRYSICDDCDRIVHEDNIYYCSNDGNSYCEDCYDDHCNNYIEDYSYKPTPIFLGYTEDNLYLGVELEVDKGENRNYVSKTLYESFEDIYMKYDGSLSASGFEIVSNPATLNYHISELGWDKIMDICKLNDYRSHDTSTCGLHVHLSRAFLGNDETEQDLNIAKLIILFDRWWEKYIIPFSRRDIYSIERWADKPSVDCLHTDSESQLIDKVKYYKAGGRYKAINLANENTIEFRLFRGTLNFNTFIASLQFVVTVTSFAKSVKLKDIFTTSWDDVFSCTEYPELKEYLKQRNLLKEVM